MSGVRPRAGSGPRRVGWVALTSALLLSAGACAEPDPEHLPDEVLRRELGLTDDDRVHTVVVTGGVAESAEPALDSVATGTWLQFVSGDWLVHEVSFDTDGMTPTVRSFLERTDQLASPPLLTLDARFVVSLAGAPPGRYPYVLQGNGEAGRGLVVVVDPEAR